MNIRFKSKIYFYVCFNIRCIGEFIIRDEFQYYIKLIDDAIGSVDDVDVIAKRYGVPNVGVLIS